MPARLPIGALVAMWLGAACAGEPAGFSVGPAPVWVAPVEAPVPTAAQLAKAEGGILTTLMDRQIRAEPREWYARGVFIVLDAAGVQDGSSVGASFAPDYERLIFHHARIHRNGAVIDALVPEAIRVISTHDSPGAQVITGRMHATLHLPDVRPGDTIDYAYTVEGQHPLMAGEVDEFLSLAWVHEIPRLHTRLLLPPAKPVQTRSFAGAPAPVHAGTPDAPELVWDLRDQPPGLIEEATPSEHFAWPSAQVSSFAGWAAVVRWALPLYEPPQPPGPEVAALAGRFLSAGNSTEERILAALRHVQEELRYLSVAIGPGSHKPRTPEECLASGFGDCKDKARLLVAILDVMGIEAWPVLVHSERRAAIGEMLPSAGAFDHVVVAVRDGERTRLLDPTRTHQRGSLDSVNANAFGAGLPLRAGAAAIEALPVTQAAHPRSSVAYRFRSYGTGKPGHVEILHSAHGEAADRMRRYYASMSPESIQRERLAFYAAWYPEFVPLRAAVVTDDEAANAFQVSESYQVPYLWQRDNDSGSYFLDIGAWGPRTHLSLPPQANRRAPIAIGYPTDLEERVRVDLHAPIRARPRRQHIEGAGCRFTSEVATSSLGRTITLTGRLKTTDGSVRQHAFADYRRFVAELRESASLRITFPAETRPPSLPQRVKLPPPSGETSWVAAGIFGAWTLLVVVGSAVWGGLRSKRTSPAHDGPAGLGGILLPASLWVAIQPALWLPACALALPYALDHSAWSHFLVAPPAGIATLLAASINLLAATAGFALSLALLAAWFRKRAVARPIAVTQATLTALYFLGGGCTLGMLLLLVDLPPWLLLLFAIGSPLAIAAAIALVASVLGTQRAARTFTR